MAKDQFYKQQYFDNLDDRLDTIEGKLDSLTTKVTWIYATASAVGMISSLFVSFILKK